MFPRHLGYELAIFTVVCAVALFLFPAVGPSISVHGPMAAWLNLRSKGNYWLAKAEGGLNEFPRTPRTSPTFTGADHSGATMRSTSGAPPVVIRC